MDHSKICIIDLEGKSIFLAMHPASHLAISPALLIAFLHLQLHVYRSPNRTEQTVYRDIEFTLFKAEQLQKIFTMKYSAQAKKIRLPMEDFKEVQPPCVQEGLADGESSSI